MFWSFFCLCASKLVTEGSAGFARFAHLVNLLPFEDPGQRVAISSWLNAKDAATAQGIDVSLHTVEIAGETGVWRPPSFRRLPDLTRTTRQVMATVFDDAPNLPLLRDVLERALLLPAEFVVLTTADIGLVPNFYSEVLEILRQAPVKALSINRVGIGNWSSFVPKATAEAVELGPILELSRHFSQLHPGSDCFVFERATVERMIPAVGYVFFGQAPFGQLMLEAMRHVTGREPVVIARRRLTFHLDPLEVNRNFDWKDRSHKSTELLALNNMAGFGLSPGKLMFQSLPDSSAILERVHRHFVVPGEVDLNKTGYFVDLGQCFSKNGTISGVALVAMCTSPKETTTVLGIDRFHMVNSTTARFRGRRRVFGLPPDLRQKKFGPRILFFSLDMKFAAGDCLGFIWHHDWAGLILGAEDLSDQQPPTLYLGLERGRDPAVNGRFTFPVRLRQRFALRAIVHYESDEQQWLNQVRREMLTSEQ
ncbi:kidins220 [Symbiodinium necroappetens]|uniref:Kidins220 protein n=1 Tax=Symbiodinium necroappetens TaxID=1628268 RepID=A0A812PUH3_9DINO|nr:kidins220 [Symbiodinium necroappetens]